MKIVFIKISTFRTKNFSKVIGITDFYKNWQSGSLTNMEQYETKKSRVESWNRWFPDHFRISHPSRYSLFFEITYTNLCTSVWNGELTLSNDIPSILWCGWLAVRRFQRISKKWKTSMKFPPFSFTTLHGIWLKILKSMMENRNFRNFQNLNFRGLLYFFNRKWWNSGEMTENAEKH